MIKSKERLIALWCVFLHEGLTTGRSLHSRENEVLARSGEGARELYSRLYDLAEAIYDHVADNLEELYTAPGVFEYSVISELGNEIGDLITRDAMHPSLFQLTPDSLVLHRLTELLEIHQARKEEILRLAEVQLY